MTLHRESQSSGSEKIKEEKKHWAILNSAKADCAIFTVLNTISLTFGSINNSSPIFDKEWIALAITEKKNENNSCAKYKPLEKYIYSLFTFWFGTTHFILTIPWIHHKKIKQ